MWAQKKNQTMTLLGLLVVVVTAAIYMPIAGYDFVAWDDDLHVYANPRLHPVTWSHIFAFWEAPYQYLYIPLTYTAWAALAWLSTHLIPMPTLPASLFHCCNLLVHLGSTFVSYRLGLLLGLNPVAAAVGAAAFSLHPLQVEPVAWVSGLKDVLCGWWALMAVWAALVYLQTPGHRSRRRHYCLATMAFFLALLAKPAAVVVPAIVGILAIGALGMAWRPVVRAWGWWILIAIGWSVWTKGQQPDALLTDIPPLGQRLFIAADAVWFYVGKVIWPVGLGPDYGRTPQVVLAQGEYWQSIVGVLGLAGILLWTRKQYRILAVGGAIFGISLLPMLGVVPFAFQAFSTVADRYSYLALVGFGLSTGWVIQRCTRTWQMALLGLAVIGLLGGRSAQQIQMWSDTPSLLTHALQVNPRSILAHNNLGLVQAQQGDLDAAIAHYQQALHANPHVAAVHYNLGNALLRQGQQRQALVHYRQAVQLKPTWAEAHNNLGSALDDAGQVAEAILHYQTAIQLQPQFASAYNNLGDALFKQGRTAEAIEHFHTAVRLQPTWAEAHYNLAIAFTKQGEEQAAIAAYRAALAAKPNWLRAALPLAWLLATQQPPSLQAAAEAVVLAEQASRLPGAHQAVAQYTLALAHRTIGNAAAALSAAQRALALATVNGDTELEAKIQATFPAVIEKG